MSPELDFYINRLLYALKKNLKLNHISLEVLNKVYKIGQMENEMGLDEFYIKDRNKLIGKLIISKNGRLTPNDKLTINNCISFIKHLVLAGKDMEVWNSIERIRKVGAKILELFSLDIRIETLLNVIARHFSNITEGAKLVKIQFKSEENEFTGSFGDENFISHCDNILSLSHIEEEAGKFTKINLYFEKSENLKEGEEIISPLSFLTHVIHSNIKEFLSERKLKSLSDDIIRILIESLEAKDPFTKGHSSGVAFYATKIAERMGFSKEKIEKIRIAALLHDIGKIAISDRILKKASQLSPVDYEEIKKHPEWSYRILSRVDSLKEIATWTRFHHERIDGSGYPFGIKGDEMPIESQIIAISDTIESMIAGRPYSERKKREEVIEEIEKFSGKHWKENIARIAIDILKEEEKNVKEYLFENT